MYLLPGGVEETRYNRGHVYSYPDRIIDALVDRLRDVDVVGISFMTNYFDRAVQITEALRRRLDIPLIWGGVHPTIRPEEAIEYVDFVCVGEGELALEEFLKRLQEGRSLQDTPNFWIRRHGEIVKNDQLPLIKNLDELPAPDYSLTEHYSIDLRTWDIIPQDATFLQRTFPVRPNLSGGFDIGYVTMTERGCPFRCTYCINDRLRRMAGKQQYLRRRSIDNVMAELRSILVQLPFVGTIIFFDDTLAARPLQELEDFSVRYREEIKVPFHGQVSPSTITERKWQLLLDAGMIFVEMGIQTANKRIAELYQRTSTNEQVIEAARLINGSADRILEPCYHVILDNPWEQPGETLETLRLVLSLPRPFWLKRASLVLFPGTQLHQKAMAEGLIEDERKDIYRKHLHTPAGTYVNFLFYLSDWRYIPRGLLKLLAAPRMVTMLHRPHNSGFYQGLTRFFEGLDLMGKGISAVVHGDFSRIFRYIGRIT